MVRSKICKLNVKRCKRSNAENALRRGEQKLYEIPICNILKQLCLHTCFGTLQLHPMHVARNFCVSRNFHRKRKMHLYLCFMHTRFDRPVSTTIYTQKQTRSKIFRSPNISPRSVDNADDDPTRIFQEKCIGHKSNVGETCNTQFINKIFRLVLAVFMNSAQSL